MSRLNPWPRPGGVKRSVRPHPRFLSAPIQAGPNATLESGLHPPLAGPKSQDPPSSIIPLQLSESPISIAPPTG